MEQQKKLSNLVSEMTLEEKTKMVNGATLTGSAYRECSFWMARPV